MESQSKIISVELDDGTVVKIEATSVGASNSRGLQARPFSEAMTAIESLSKEIAETIQKNKPHQATVKFGVDIGIDSGKLTVVLAKGTATANLEIVLQWNN
jgi:phosphotransferase system HPr-like phosphotransfer protein